MLCHLTSKAASLKGLTDIDDNAGLPFGPFSNRKTGFGHLCTTLTVVCRLNFSLPSLKFKKI